MFTYQDGRPIHPQSIRQRFERLAAAAGLPRITFHDLRHSYAGALRAGVSPKVISERIGHANVGFFLETYAHVLGDDDREAAEQAAVSCSATHGSRMARTARSDGDGPAFMATLSHERGHCCWDVCSQNG